MYLAKGTANIDKAPSGLHSVPHLFSTILAKDLQYVAFKKPDPF